MRNEQDATSLYKMVKIREDQLSLEEPPLPRKRKAPNRVNFLYDYKESASHHYEKDNDFYRAQKQIWSARLPDVVGLPGAVGLDVDQRINMLKTIYKDKFDYIQLKSQLIFKFKIEITVQYNTSNEGTD